MFRAVAYLSLSASHCDIHESTSVLYSLLGAALWCLLLLLWFNLRTMLALIIIEWFVEEGMDRGFVLACIAELQLFFPVPPHPSKNRIDLTFGV